jgi:hypothetical protein
MKNQTVRVIAIIGVVAIALGALLPAISALPF